MVQISHDINETETSMGSDDIPLKQGDLFTERYYELNKRLLCVTGLWPGQSLQKKGSRTGSLLIACLIIMAAQVRAMVRAWGRFNLFAECITPLATNIGGIIKLTSAMIHTQEMRNLFDTIQKDWKDLRHSSQFNILKECGEKGRRWTIFYFALTYATIASWLVMAFSPKIMDAIIPLNYSRQRFDLFPTDFMVDPDDYYYPILIFISCALLYHVLVYVAMDTLYMVIAQHGCAMFKILTYTLHNVHDDESTEVNLEPNVYEDVHYHEIISCIKKHKVIIEYITSIESTCKWKLFIIVGLNMLGLSFTGYMAIAMRDESTTMDAARYAFFAVTQVIHLFCNTLPGHWIMESSSLVPHAAYSCKWYMMSLRSRKLILFLIRASIEPCKITAGKIYIMSVENVSSVLKTSISYLAMLNSVQ